MSPNTTPSVSAAAPPCTAGVLGFGGLAAASAVELIESAELERLDRSTTVQPRRHSAQSSSEGTGHIGDHADKLSRVASMPNDEDERDHAELDLERSSQCRIRPPSAASAQWVP